MTKTIPAPQNYIFIISFSFGGFRKTLELGPGAGMNAGAASST